MKSKDNNAAYRIVSPDGTEHHFTENYDHAELARKNGYDVRKYIHAVEMVYQERRYEFIGKRQLEYWADIDRGVFSYLPKSERRIICVMTVEAVKP